MSRRRSSTYDALATTKEPRYLKASNRHSLIVCWRTLAPYTDLRHELRTVLDAMGTAGWTIEPAMNLYLWGSCYCHRGPIRVHVSIIPTFPSNGLDPTPPPPESASTEEWLETLFALK